MERAAVPFTAKRYGSSYTEEVTTTGVMRVDGDHLVLEFQDESLDYTSLARELGDVESVSIPLSDVDAVTVSRKWLWGGSVTIRTRTMGILGRLPIARGSECTLRIRRADHDRARELAVGISLHIANEAMRRIEGGEPTP
ncbi:MAG: hypothetical protein L0271_27245 [Gemmatimonadetes bacterium]|nr:hypothetical protein [Gemmatimonadota bacterium]